MPSVLDGAGLLASDSVVEAAILTSPTLKKGLAVVRRAVQPGGHRLLDILEVVRTRSIRVLLDLRRNQRGSE